MRYEWGFVPPGGLRNTMRFLKKIAPMARLLGQAAITGAVAAAGAAAFTPDFDGKPAALVGIAAVGAFKGVLDLLKRNPLLDETTAERPVPVPVRREW